jgi:hypothetical protein
MPILLTLLIAAILVGGLAFPLSRVLWPEVIEGQVGKQSFVGHMIESWMRGDTDRGFPVRYFVEPWHPGPVPWAEEVPLFHWISASLGQLTGLNAVQSGRVASFGFALILLFSVRGIARRLFPATPPTLAEPVSPASRASVIAIALAPTLLVWMPAFQIYSSSVIPDLAMLAMIAFGYWLRLQSPQPTRPSGSAYLALMIACLLKYFAVFALGALFVYDWLADRDPRTRWRTLGLAFSYSALAGAPTLAYLYYFISRGIPNPITEYRTANGYGHLAGPFLFQAKFYLRFVTWTLIKNPTLVVSAAALGGWALVRRTRAGRGPADASDLHAPAWRLLHLHTAAYLLFALVFASAFYVHDYYAIPFLLPVLFYAVAALSWALNRAGLARVSGAAVVAGAITLGYLLSQDATFRLTNYLAAGEQVRATLSAVPDRDGQAMVAFVSDFSLPVIPILSRKAGWAFNADQLEVQRADFLRHLGQARAVVFYVREPGGSALIDQWRATDPRLAGASTAADTTVDRSFPSEGRKGSATRLLILPIR